MYWKWTLILCFIIGGCYQNGRDAIATHQIIAEPKSRLIHWQEEVPIAVTEKRINEPEPCQTPLLF